MAHFRSSHHTLRRLLGQHQNPSSDRITNSLLFAAQGLRFRKLEVILTANIDKLGKAGDTVKVAPGFFRNHLMPKLLAVPNIEKFRHIVSEQRKLYQRKEEETVMDVSKTKAEALEIMDDSVSEHKLKEYREVALRLHNGRLCVKRLVQSGNELRLPVTKEELVAEAARQLNVCIYPANLHLPSPLTSTGEFDVPLRLPKVLARPPGALQWVLKVKVRRKKSGKDPLFGSPSLPGQITAENTPTPSEPMLNQES